MGTITFSKLSRSKMNDKRAQYLFILFIQSIVFILLCLGHGQSVWQSQTKSVIDPTLRPHGGIWVNCDVTKSGCSFLEEDDVGENKEWIKVNCARAFLLLANVLGLVEIILCVLTQADMLNNLGSKTFVPHLILFVAQVIFALVSAILITETFDVLKDRSTINAGWSLVCLWIGCFILLPLTVMPLGKCSRGLHENEDDDTQLMVET